MPEKVMIVTGRFQPLHLGHLQFWREARRIYGEHLIICVLRRSRRVKSTSLPSNSFQRLAVLAQARDQNPIPNWHRLRLVTLAIEADPFLHGNTTVLTRARPDIWWDESVADLPQNRVWIFNPNNSEFDKAKPTYYESKGEEVRLIEFTDPQPYSGEQIRAALRNGSRDFTFMPEACQDYFQRECLPYILDQTNDD